MDQARQGQAPGKAMSNLDLATSLGASCVDLGTALETHMKAFGTLIPHMFMGDVLGHVRRQAFDLERQTELGAILDCLERGMHLGGRETRNVISISFLREGEDESFFPSIAARLGPRMRAQLRVKAG